MQQFAFNIPLNDDYNQFLAQPPFRSANKIRSLANTRFNENPSFYEIKLTQPLSLNSFDVKESIKQYGYKAVSSPGSFIADIFFPSGRRVAFLLMININTRKAFAQILGDIDLHEVINVDEEMREMTTFIPRQGIRTTAQLIAAFQQIMQQSGPIKILRSDGERGLMAHEFQQFLRDNNIRFIPVRRGQHSSLGLIDRLCRTLRDMAFNMNIEILSQEQMQMLIDYYNQAPHNTLSDIILTVRPDLKLQYPNGIAPNDMTRELERILVKELLKHNILNDQQSILQPMDIVKVFNPRNKFDKRRSELRRDDYIIDRKEGYLYQVRNMRTDEIDHVPRFFLKPK